MHGVELPAASNTTKAHVIGVKRLTCNGGLLAIATFHGRAPNVHSRRTLCVLSVHLYSTETTRQRGFHLLAALAF